MNLYTENILKRTLELIEDEKSKYFGNKLPAALTQQPVYKLALEKNEELQIATLLSSLESEGLIIAYTEDTIKYYLEINCTKYFFDRENKDVDYSEYHCPDYRRHFDNYDEKDKCDIRPTGINPDKITEKDIIDIQTNELIVQIKKSVLYKKGIEIEVKELSYSCGSNGSYDYNKIFNYISTIGYNIEITISDAGEARVTFIKFNFMSK